MAPSLDEIARLVYPSDGDAEDMRFSILTLKSNFEVALPAGTEVVIGPVNMDKGEHVFDATTQFGSMRRIVRNDADIYKYPDN
ncbi:MAG: hypothetical protein UX91_C0004G0024 [Candidatus Amesbacteria bacterium GW2011_GWB1_47_19]|nr:MAG: hypothetical protein UW51_C0005G0024 [Candidatus Amesbacteria bacterium GW2011_GWA1_44_24]KKU31581.1 MAG: hypothetical protein UX46_C0004G0024 [Candidatus Amesbacteria bacterium GW2011_GWC1_46_24]KKU67354.1 MAG: hypothetical protein UX91_C0004G0024 [Candidatus Amesbacteria bacterium GW2011_GWB1_47_19]OGD05231.1 MAG: hypothetical protein A2379_04460 [Candidatus Amesbacteria bacterium RIFOXYB1_FULL_47_13]HBC72596.1 hypothetical protein [Candidatus Amesbacteria bacterium]